MRTTMRLSGVIYLWLQKYGVVVDSELCVRV